MTLPREKECCEHPDHCHDFRGVCSECPCHKKTPEEGWEAYIRKVGYGDDMVDFIRENRKQLLAEVVKELEGMKSNCQSYHSERIDTPEKIGFFNWVLERAITKIKSLV